MDCIRLVLAKFVASLGPQQDEDFLRHSWPEAVGLQTTRAGLRKYGLHNR